MWPQCLQNESLQQRYSLCKSKKPNFNGDVKNKFHKNLNFHLKKILEWLSKKKKLNLYIFRTDFMTNQLKLIVPKKYWFRSWKGSNIWALLGKGSTQKKRQIIHILWISVLPTPLLGTYYNGSKFKFQPASGTEWFSYKVWTKNL